jgi:cell division protein FtsB
MQHLHRLLIATIVAIGFALPSGVAGAQAVKQIQLTEKQVLGYIAAQKEMPASENPDAKAKAQMESVAKKNGFASFAEFEDVAANISMIVDGIDPKTKAFTEPLDGLKKEIAEVQADKSMPAKDKQAALKELNEALKTAQPVQFRGNIELVKKYFDKLQPAS